MAAVNICVWPGRSGHFDLESVCIVPCFMRRRDLHILCMLSQPLLGLLPVPDLQALR